VLAKKSLLYREVLRSVLLDVEGAEQRRFKVLDQLDALDRFGRIRDQSALGEVGESDAYNLASLSRPDYILSIAATSAPFAVAFAGSFAR